MIRIIGYLLPSALILAVLFSCGNDDEQKKMEDDSKSPNQTLMTNFDNKVFSIPSPIQTSMLIKQLNLPFYEDVLNPVENTSHYTTKASQALNLGVYGTDLGYVSLYNQNSYSIKYLAAVQKLTEKLGLEGAFDKKFLDRFEKSLSNQDSLMILVADAFKKADLFLKNSSRKSDAALILAGGWIESMYISSEINRQESSPRIVERIGEQKWSLNSVIELLSEYNDEGTNDDLIRDLKDLQFFFEKIDTKYTYNEPTTDVARKTTMLNHKIEIKIDTDILNQISMKIRTIREKITK